MSELREKLDSLVFNCLECMNHADDEIKTFRKDFSKENKDLNDRVIQLSVEDGSEKN